jgi:hypothetical protein
VKEVEIVGTSTQTPTTTSRGPSVPLFFFCDYISSRDGDIAGLSRTVRTSSESG